MLAPEILRLARPPDEIMHLLFGRVRHGSLIALGTRRPDRQGNVTPRFFTAIPADALQQYFPNFLRLTIEAEQTGYMGVNTLKRTALVTKGRRAKTDADYLQAIEDGTPQYFRHRKHHVRELVSLFMDLDVGKEHGDGLPRMDAREAVLLMQRLAIYGHIPYPSMLALSGTGAYALWCLRDEEHPALPPLHTRKNEHILRLIGRAAHHALAEAYLHPDPKAQGIAQWCKVPGTIDTKTGNEVVFMPYFLPDAATGRSSIPLYTFRDLAAHFDVASVDIEHHPAPAFPAPAMISGAGGMPIRYPLPVAKTRRAKDGTPSKAQAPYEARLRDLESVASDRGGIGKGKRWQFCLHYFSQAWAYFGIAYEATEAHRRACDLLAAFNARWCKPALPHPEVVRIMSKNRLRAQYHTIMRQLDITAEESERLQLRALIPYQVRAQRTQRKAVRSGGLRSRRQTIEKMIRERLTNAQIFAAAAQYDLPAASLPAMVCRMRKKLCIPNPKRGAHPLQVSIGVDK